ncbi:MAG: glycosyltransferase family 9 protein [Gaiellales bacterium]
MTPTVVVVRALGLGDFLTAVPAYRSLRRCYPGHRLILCAPGPLSELAALTGAIDELRPTSALAPLHPDLHGAAIAVNLHGRGPQSHRLIHRAQPERVIAFAHPSLPWSSRGPSWRADEHEIDRWCRLLESFGIASDRADMYLRPPGASRDQRLTVIHPGAASASRRWPASRFAEVARAEAARGRRVVVTGSAAERRLAARVATDAGLPADAVAAGRTGLADLVSLVARAGRVVCGDTGVAHLATAVRTPSVIMFGPMSPALWGPTDRERHRVLWRGISGDPHGDTPDPGLLAIETDEVLEALASLEPAVR